MTDIIEQAKATLKGATEAPWIFVGGMDADHPDAEDSSVVSEGERTASGYGYEVAVDLRYADAAFIAQARTLVPELVAEVQRLRLAVAGPYWRDAEGNVDWDAHADEARRALAEPVAESIWKEEQSVTAALADKPTDPHLNGVLRGLQIARDLVNGGTAEAYR